MTDPRGRHVTLNKPEEPQNPNSMHHGGSFKKYMQFKNQKLREQFVQDAIEAEGDQGLDKSKLFSGISIHVNGFTVPTHQELRQIMASHGGTFEVYYSRQRVTHIICSNLPNAKIKALEKERSSTPIVRPEWIVDCIKSARILPHEDYLLWRLRDKPNQATLTAFQAQPVSRSAALLTKDKDQQGRATVHQPAAVFHKSPSSDATQSPSKKQQPASTRASPGLSQEQAGVSSKHTSCQEEASLGQQDCMGERRDQQHPAQGAIASMRLANAAGQAGPAPNSDAPGPSTAAADCAGAAGLQLPAAAPESELTMETGQILGTVTHGSHARGHFLAGGNDLEAAGWQSSLEDSHLAKRRDSVQPLNNRPSSSGSGEGSLYEHGQGTKLHRAQQVAASARAACDLLKGAPKSSREDPQFMDNYYKSSRLHFIGTWKARIEALAAKSAGTVPVPKTTTGLRPLQRTIIHLDMDCFFASVAALTDPSLRGLPLVVCHSNSAQGTGEVSSANYEARSFGISAVMCIGEAKRLSPSLIVMPYQYDKYQTISEQVYNILMQYTVAVQPISCDEAFLDVTGLGDGEQIAASLRAQILKETGCTASAGISYNMLLARLATKAGKPNGQFRLTPDQVDHHLLQLKVDSLPGVGWSTRQRLEAMNIHTVADLRDSNQDALQRELGTRNGAMLWAAAHGQDERAVEPMKLRRSVGAEVNWGIRFTCEEDADTFLDGLAGELQSRMKEAGVKGRSITLKIKRRKSNAPEPIKFLGHGPCDNISRSVTLNSFTDSLSDLTRESRALLRALRIPATQIRGIGISVSKLDNDSASSASGSIRGALPRAAPPATAFRPFKRSDIGASELTVEDLIAAGKTTKSGPLPGLSTERLALLPQNLRELASPEKQPEAGCAGQSEVAVDPRAGRARQPGSISLLWAAARTSSVDNPASNMQAPLAPADGPTSADTRDPSREPDQHPGHSDLLWPSFNMPDAHPQPILEDQHAAITEETARGRLSEADRHESSAADVRPTEAALSNVDSWSDDIHWQDLAKEDTAAFEISVAESLCQDGTDDAPSYSTELRNPASPGCVYSGLPLELSPGAEPSQQDCDMLAGGEQCGSPCEHQARPALELKATPAGDTAAPSTSARPPAAAPTPIQALPPVSQVDASVLDALPLQMKREIERAMGIGAVRSPPNRGKRKVGGGRHTAVGRPAKRQLIEPRPARFSSRQQSELTPSRVDLDVLRELPLELQQELAADMARSRKLAACRPIQQSSFVQFPAPPVRPQPQKKAQGQPEAEDPRSLWPKFKQALDQIADQIAQDTEFGHAYNDASEAPLPHCRQSDVRLGQGQAEGGCIAGETTAGSSEQGLSSDADCIMRRDTNEQLVALEGVLLEFGNGLVQDDLEGLQYLLRQLEAVAVRMPKLAANLRRWEQTLNSKVAQHWSGMSLVLSRVL